MASEVNVLDRIVSLTVGEERGRRLHMRSNFVTLRRVGDELTIRLGRGNTTVDVTEVGSITMTQMERLASVLQYISEWDHWLDLSLPVRIAIESERVKVSPSWEVMVGGVSFILQRLYIRHRQLHLICIKTLINGRYLQASFEPSDTFRFSQEIGELCWPTRSMLERAEEHEGWKEMWSANPATQALMLKWQEDNKS